MRVHIRTDTFKVFDKEDKILQSIIEEKKLSAKQGKSEAYRIALHSYDEHKKIIDSFESLKSIVKEVVEEQKQTYFVNQALIAQVNDLIKIVQTAIKQ